MALAGLAFACNGYDDDRNAEFRNDARDEWLLGREQGATGTSGTATSSDGSVRVADLMANPNAYVGREVTVVADLEEVLGPSALVLDEDAAFRAGIDNDLLVLAKTAGKLEHVDDQWLNNKVRVTGTVGRVSVVEVEREIDWELDPEMETEIEHSGAILIADSIERTSR
jgi:hypothetical protein